MSSALKYLASAVIALSAVSCQTLPPNQEPAQKPAPIIEKRVANKIVILYDDIKVSDDWMDKLDRPGAESLKLKFAGFKAKYSQEGNDIVNALLESRLEVADVLVSGLVQQLTQEHYNPFVTKYLSMATHFSYTYTEYISIDDLLKKKQAEPKPLLEVHQGQQPLNLYPPIVYRRIRRTPAQDKTEILISTVPKELEKYLSR